MTTQTEEQGRRFEALYDACMKLPADQREDFISSQTVDDPQLGAQLRVMVKLDHPPSTNLFQTGGVTRGDRSDDLTSGIEFGKCRIVSLIDAGAMGAVYFALDLQNHERPVALKVMRPTLLAERDRERFMRESSALSRLVHPNIARLYFRDVEKWNDTERPFLVMEFVDGETLDKFLANGHLSTRQVLELLAKIARAVHHGHRNGVFHRDLKPSNILVSPDGEPKIIDYGVSFTVSGESASSEDSVSHENAGTVPYMAPEVASGAAYIPDARTDVYSLGIIAFEAFAHRQPGVKLASGQVELLNPPIRSGQMRQKIAVCERERLRDAHRGVAVDLDCVIAKALRLKIEDRYADAGEFAEDLRRLIDFEPIKELRKSHMYNAKLFVRRNQLAVIAALAIFATVSAAAIDFRSQRNQVNAALVKEAVARKKAEDESDQIRRQDAIDHMREALLAEQRGSWAAAAEEYLAAEQGGYPDHLALAVGELRAFDRLGRAKDAQALIDRVTQSMPDVAESPQFQVVQGFFFWTSDPDRSVRQINSALQHSNQLAPKDHSFAEALITDDVTVVAKKLRETLELDPFNHDALAVLALCDIAMAQTQQCEQDAGVLQRLFPEDPIGPCLAAFACAFEGRRDAAVVYTNSNPRIPPKLRTALIDLNDLMGEIHSIDDLRSTSIFQLEFRTLRILDNLELWPGAENVRLPFALTRVLTQAKPALVYEAVTHPDSLWKIVAQWPNGNGVFAAGWLALKQGDLATAERDFTAAVSAPYLIDCRRTIAIALTLTHSRDNRLQHVPVAQGAAVVRTDIDRLISLGGIHPEKFPEESLVATTAIDYQLYPQLRTLTLAWLFHAPDDPKAMYFLARADENLDDRGMAMSLYQHAIEKELAGDLRSDALARIEALKPSTLPTTAPADVTRERSLSPSVSANRPNP